MPWPIMLETNESMAPLACGVFMTRLRDRDRMLESDPKITLLGPMLDVPQLERRRPVPAAS